MGYSGDQKPQDRKFDKNGELIDPEDKLLDSIAGMFSSTNNNFCFKCRHLNKDRITCRAFPIAIPRDISLGKIRHDKPYTNDKGIQFEPKE